MFTWWLYFTYIITRCLIIRSLDHILHPSPVLPSSTLFAYHPLCVLIFILWLLKCPICEVHVLLVMCLSPGAWPVCWGHTLRGNWVFLSQQLLIASSFPAMGRVLCLHTCSTLRFFSSLNQVFCVFYQPTRNCPVTPQKLPPLILTIIVPCPVYESLNLNGIECDVDVLFRSEILLFSEYLLFSTLQNIF